MGIILIFVLFLGFVVLTLPIAFSMELSTILTMVFNGQGNALITVLTKMFSGTNSTSFLAIPFFILAGALMEQGGISDKILEFANGLVGHLRGGLAMVTVVYATLFSAVTGSAVAATTAVGATMMPAMNKKGYDKGFTAALQASAGTLGPIIPPSVSMIMISAMTGESVANLFLAGFVPGFMIAAFLMLVGYLYARRHEIPKEPKQSGKETLKAFAGAIWALLSPVIIIGGILSGMFTATEAGMISCVYSIIVGMFVYKGLTVKKLVEVFKKSVIGSAQIMFLVAMANVFAWILTRNSFGTLCAELLGDIASNRVTFMLLMVLFFLILGCFLEGAAMCTIFVPIFYPIAQTYGVGFPLMIVMLMCVALGQITPPVGVLLSVTSEMQGIKLTDTFKYLPSVLGALLAATVLCAVFPQIITILPHLFGTL